MFIRSDKRAMYALYLMAFVDLFAVSLFLPLMSREIRDLGLGDPISIGILLSIYGAVQLFSSPIMGWSSDMYGAKVVLIICLAATTLAYTLQGYASSLLLFLVARAIAGCFKHTQTIGKSIISDLAPHEKSHVLGNFNAFGSMGFIVGPTVGAYLVELENGFQSVCLLAAVAFIFNIFILLIFISKKRKHSPSKTRIQESGKSKFCMPSVLSQSSPDRYSVFGLLLLRFLYSSSTIIPRANLPLILESKYATSVVSVGYLNSSQALVSTLVGFMVGPVVSWLFKNNSSSMVKASGFLKVISLFALVFAPSFRLAGLSMLLQSAADPFLRVGITSMSLEGQTEDPGAILGLGQTATSLSRMLAPFVAGIAQSISDDGPAVVGTIAAFLGLVGSYMFSGTLIRSTDIDKKVS